jgi:hypothetical protein
MSKQCESPFFVVEKYLLSAILVFLRDHRPATHNGSYIQARENHVTAYTWDFRMAKRSSFRANKMR